MLCFSMKRWVWPWVHLKTARTFYIIQKVVFPYTLSELEPLPIIDDRFFDLDNVLFEVFLKEIVAGCFYHLQVQEARWLFDCRR